MISRRYHIATATDEHYYVPMYVMLKSLFENNTSLSFTVYILYSGLDEKQKEQADVLATIHGSTFHWLHMNDERTEHFYTSHYIKVSSYYRIFIEELLPASVNQVLYLDADLIVCEDIKPLLDIDMGNTPLMAIKEAVPYNIERLGIPKDKDYFNAGVLLINVDEWRKQGYSNELIHNIEKEHANYLMHDQDALNALFYDKATYIDSKWNHQTGFYHLPPQQLAMRYNKDVSAILNKPAIIHFTTISKPWMYENIHPFKTLFLKYLEQTPFNTFAEKASVSKWLGKMKMRVKHKIQKLAGK